MQAENKPVVRGMADVRSLLIQLRSKRIVTVQDAVLFTQIVSEKTQDVSNLLANLGQRVGLLEGELGRKNNPVLSMTKEQTAEIRNAQVVESVEALDNSELETKEKIAADKARLEAIKAASNVTETEVVEETANTTEVVEEVVEKADTEVDTVTDAKIAAIKSAAKSLLD